MAFQPLSDTFNRPVIISVHPHTHERLIQNQVDTRGLVLLEPLGLFDFVKLEQNAFCILSDSGTVSEEASILGIPLVTLRDVTERPETIECGSNIQRVNPRKDRARDSIGS